MIEETTVKQLDTHDLAFFLAESEQLYKESMDFKVRSDYYDAYFKYEVDPKIIMYESYFGRGVIDNPAAIFEYILKDERFSGFKHIWSLEKGDFRDQIMDRYKEFNNVIFVEPKTRDYYMYLSKAKYLINNVTWANYVVKKENQVIINTWHGIPLKHIGYDTPTGAIAVENIMRNFLMTDYLLSPVPYMTEKYTKSHKLEGIFEGAIIETGYPRVDNTVKVNKEEVFAELKVLGVNCDSAKKVILYAPTFRENYINDGIDVNEYNQFIREISKYIDLEEYQILFKPHQFVYKELLKKGLLQDNFVPALIDTNKLLGITDILISDYSSIFFDYLVTDKPILFYITDMESYRQQRGLYLDVEDLPGPITNQLSQLGEWIAHIDNYKEFFDYQKYIEAKQRYVANDDGNVCQRVVDTVFFNDQSAKIIKCNGDKPKILFHLDSCKKNGITSSITNLLQNLDYEKYDISLSISDNKKQLLEFFKTIPDSVRCLKRVGSRVNNIEDYAKVNYCIENGISEVDGTDEYPRKAFEIEYKRFFGDARFDYIINFNGTSAYWANIHITEKDPIKLIWMHSVIEREYNRPVGGVYAFRKNLNTLYKIYHKFDACVSCSNATMEMNKNHLLNIGQNANMTYARNLINKQRIIAGASNYSKVTYNSKEYYAEQTESEGLVLTPLPKKGNTVFVTVGRLGVEKNHINLVKAFARLNKTNPDIQLYIIGAGEYGKDIKKIIRDSKCVESVVLTGNLQNPFAIMGLSDCFILPSYYEGQPLVLLEARTLKLPIIMSNFDTAKDSVYEKGQLVIGTSEDEIYEGLKAFLEGNVPNEYSFDLEQYNSEALNEFENCLEFARKQRG